MNTTQTLIITLLIFIVAAFAALLQYEGLDLIDEATYAEMVHRFLHQHFFAEKASHFSNRIGLLLPTAISASLLSEKPISFVLFSFICYATLALFSFFSFRRKQGFFIALLLLLNPVISKLSVKLLPDVPQLFFWGSLVLMLLKFYDTKKITPFQLLIFLVLFLWGSSCKETMLFFSIPLLLTTREV